MMFYLAPFKLLNYPLAALIDLFNTTRNQGMLITKIPNENWIRARIFGEIVNEKLRRHVVNKLREAGFEALAPILTPNWKKMPSERFLFSSKWSERHAAFASGLGTFGLSDGLITPKGKAMRTGSIIAQIELPSNNKPYDNHNSYCLFYTKGICGKCIDRCPIGAITVNGHDKNLCSKYLTMTRKYVSKHMDFEGYGCGLCQTSVPCESGIPKVLDQSRKTTRQTE